MNLHGHHAIHPSAVLSASLVLSLLLWAPTAQTCIEGNTPLTAAAIRYVMVFGFVRLALGGIVYLVNQYRAAADRELMLAVAAELEAQSADTDNDDGTPRRRVSDRVSDQS